MVDLDFDVVSLPETDHCEVGETAPDFVRPLVTEEYWEDRSLSTLAENSPVLLVFYPMDGAFPATYIWSELNECAWDQEYDLQIVGLSISTPYEHSSFIDDHDLPYPLFSDPKNTVAVEYGVVNDLDGMSGIDEARLATVLLDTDREIRDVWVAGEWPEFPPYEELESTIADVCSTDG
jgi:peroxiredoxin